MDHSRLPTVPERLPVAPGASDWSDDYERVRKTVDGATSRVDALDDRAVTDEVSIVLGLDASPDDPRATVGEAAKGNSSDIAGLVRSTDGFDDIHPSKKRVCSETVAADTNSRFV